MIVKRRPTAPIEGATPQVTPQVLRLLQGMGGDVTRAEMMAALHLKDRRHFSRDYIAPALEMALIEMSIPDKPNSRLQKYRLTDKGREVLNKEGRPDVTPTWTLKRALISPTLCCGR
ncbi:MAG: Fic family protein [Rhodoferax sp.]